MNTMYSQTKNIVCHLGGVFPGTMKTGSGFSATMNLFSASKILVDFKWKNSIVKIK